MAEEDNRTQISLRHFLESVPPGQTKDIADLGNEKNLYYTGGGRRAVKFTPPEIYLHCENESCNGLRFFQTVHEITLHKGGSDLQFVRYAEAL